MIPDDEELPKPLPKPVSPEEVIKSHEEGNLGDILYEADVIGCDRVIIDGIEYRAIGDFVWLARRISDE